jgi:2,3-bisphosphoglycerate-independent phosphoglycerate mutase
MAKKCLMIIADGGGDRPCPDLGGKTPFQAAKKPYIDSLAAHGSVGLMDVIAPGIRPGSDTSHLALFGYDPYKYYSGRGPFEAAGAGIQLEKGDVAFRCNFATIDKGVMIDLRAGRIREGTTELAAALDGMELNSVPDVKVIFRASTEHRCVLVLRGPSLSPRVNDIDPHEPGKPPQRAVAEENTDAAIRTAKALNEFFERSLKILAAHPVNETRRKQGLMPANAVIPRGAGQVMDIPSFETVWKMKGAVVSATGMIIGIARILGMDVITPPGTTANIDTSLDAKADAALRALRDHDFVVIHVKGTDIAGHDGKAVEKKAMIEQLDAMVGRLLRAVNLDDVVVVLTCDHSTPCTLKKHSADPVPLVIAGGGARHDSVHQFDEVTAVHGILARIRGLDMFRIVYDLMDRSEKFGA